MQVSSSWRWPVALALLGAAWFGTLFLADFPAGGAVERLDLWLDAWLAAHRSAQGIAVFATITAFGNAGTVAMLALGLSIALWRFGRHGRAAIQVVTLWLVPIGASVTTWWLKLAFARPRPEQAVYILPDFSFPSGHATGAAAFYGLLAWLAVWNRWLSPRVGALLGGAAVGLIGFSRLYLGVHYLSDVLNGYLVGALWALAGAWWVRRAGSA